MGFSGRLERVAAFFSDPIMLEVIPAAAQHQRVHWAGMAVA